VSNKLEIGSLIKFNFIYDGCSLNDCTALYLGESIYYGPGGTEYVNYAVHVVGEPEPVVIDRGLLSQRYMEVVSEGG
tara:strand:+ start:632 stop:862 length:231 start_codon:yes stop_codon:yes gene_type:complete